VLQRRVELARQPPLSEPGAGPGERYGCGQAAAFALCPVGSFLGPEPPIMMSLHPPLVTAQASGLPAPAIAAIQQVLARHPEVETAILYGSRARLARHPGAEESYRA
jgi:hypothetical protein